MLWTQLWFSHQKRSWEKRQDTACFSLSRGHQVYAAKQVWVWSQFLHDAQKAFNDILGNDPSFSSMLNSS